MTIGGKEVVAEILSMSLATQERIREALNGVASLQGELRAVLRERDAALVRERALMMKVKTLEGRVGDLTDALDTALACASGTLPDRYDRGEVLARCERVLLEGVELPGKPGFEVTR